MSSFARRIRNAAVAVVAVVVVLAAFWGQRTGESSPASPPEVGAPVVAASTGLMSVIEGLTVTDRSRVGYMRDAFGSGWTDADGNGCDSRNDVLARDLDDLVLDEDDCTVLSGTLHDPYTATSIEFVRGRDSSSAVQIDHIIPLAAAWTGGASGWSREQRVAFANDPANLQATDGPTNASKSDSGPGEWLPPDLDHHCAYAQAYTAIASRYGLAVTAQDVAVLREVAGRCPA